MKKNIPAVGYIRMSSGTQEASPAQQKTEIKKLSQKRDCISRRLKSQPEGRAEVKTIKVKITTLDNKIVRGTENLLLADPEHIGALSTMLTDWKQERDQLQSDLETMNAVVGSNTIAEQTKLAIAELKHLREQFRSADPALIKGVISAMVEGIELWWEMAGSRYHRVSKGVLTPRSNVGVLQSSFGIAFHSCLSKQQGGAQ